MTRKLITAFAILSLAALGLAACGGDDETTTTDAATTEETTTTEASGGGSGASSGKGGTIKVAADPDGALEYTTGDLTVDSGTVEIDFDNPASLPHDVRIEDSSGSDVGGTSVISESSETATVELEPGEYVYYCSVPGHRTAGMEQTLTVK